MELQEPALLLLCLNYLPMPVSAFLSICPNNTNRKEGNSMYKRNTDHARNKRDADAIVYQDASGSTIRLTRADFASEEEFLIWKAWSDADYHRTEKRDHIHANHTVSLEDLPDRLSALPSIDSTLADEFDCQEQKRFHTEKMELIKGCLSEIQFRRLWMHYAEGQTVREIAKREGVGYQRVHKSILAAEKKILKILQKQGDKRT